MSVISERIFDLYLMLTWNQQKFINNLHVLTLEMNVFSLLWLFRSCLYDLLRAIFFLICLHSFVSINSYLLIYWSHLLIASIDRGKCVISKTLCVTIIYSRRVKRFVLIRADISAYRLVACAKKLATTEENANRWKPKF